jgi:UDP-glucose:(heptosyl)LPS alpha-1,3-glucosyltransferase
VSGMRVALVYRRFNRGGSLERDVVQLAEGLARRGVDVHCYCNPDDRSIAPDGIRFHDVRPLLRSRSRFGQPIETGSFAAAATKALRRDRALYDVVDVTGVSAWEADVVTVHGVTKAMQRRWPEDAGRNFRAARLRAAAAPAVRPQIAVARWVERIQFRSSHVRAIAVTEEVRRDLIDVHTVAPERIDVIPPPVEFDLFAAANRADVRGELGLSSDTAVLLFVGHDFARKGLAFAIEALSGLPENVHLVVVGGGPRGQAETQAHKAGVRARVHFVGRTEHPEHYFAAADVLVLPTLQDPWGITLIEAMAAGVPVVTTAAAGASATVRAARAGVVLDDASANGVRGAVEWLLSDSDRRREVAARGREAAERLGVENHVDLVLRVYERVVSERRPHAVAAATAEAA